MHRNKTTCTDCDDLLDHLVGDGEHPGRQGEAERLGSLEVDGARALANFQVRN
jgi:hypothetical protein